MWKKCCFSGDGEYICAGSARQHALYIWEKSIGNIVKILHGTKGELLLDVAWHPVRPIIASISSGVVSVWAQNQVENWSAFAPDFKELDENVEYEERESEFDLTDEDKSVASGGDAKEDTDLEVDVCSVEPVAAFCSSDEENENTDCLQFLPIAPEVTKIPFNICQILICVFRLKTLKIRGRPQIQILLRLIKEMDRHQRKRNDISHMTLL